jgi:hypothetical protein
MITCSAGWVRVGLDLLCSFVCLFFLEESRRLPLHPHFRIFINRRSHHPSSGGSLYLFQNHIQDKNRAVNKKTFTPRTPETTNLPTRCGNTLPQSPVPRYLFLQCTTSNRICITRRYHTIYSLFLVSLLHFFLGPYFLLITLFFFLPTLLVSL